MSYAQKTKVPAEKSAVEIIKVLKKAKASQVLSGEGDGQAYIAFIHEGIAVKIRLKLPLAPAANAPKVTKNRYEQTMRQKWRGLLLCIKAKIEAVESGIETFEEAFLPHIVLKDGTSLGQTVIPNIKQLDGGSAARMLGFDG